MTRDRWEQILFAHVADETVQDMLNEYVLELEAENAKLRKLVLGLHMAYVETLNECEGLDEGLIWEYSGNVEVEVAKSKARFEADRHRFDTALRELGVEVDDA